MFYYFTINANEWRSYGYHEEWYKLKALSVKKKS